MQRTLVSTIVFFAAALSACGTSKPSNDEPTPSALTPTEPTSNNACSKGDTKPDDDGCNTCSCNENGEWACTEMDCGEAKTKASAEPCTKGDTKPSEDGCNTCLCGDNGNWGCTELACAKAKSGEPAAADAECTKGDTKPADDGCNTCSCGDNGKWSCTQLACGGS